MRTLPYDQHARTRLTGAAAAIAVHFALICGWMLARELEQDLPGEPAETIQWIDVKPPAVRPVKAASRPAPAAPRRALPPPSPLRAAPPPAVVAQALVSTPIVPEAPPARSADDILQQARRDLGRIDKDLKKEFPLRGIRAPIDSAHKRLVRGIEQASTRPSAAARITGLIDPGGQGRKRYRVETGLGTYCMTYDGPHTLNGRDQGTQPGAPKMTNCPPHEEPEKPQEW